MACKSWAQRSLRLLSFVHLDSGAGQFILNHFLSQEELSWRPRLSDLKRLSSLSIGWVVLSENIGLIEKIITAQQNLRSLLISNTGVGRLRSAAELDRIIMCCGSSLTSLCLDELNLVKCASSFSLITTTCTRLRSLSLRGAQLPPKSARFLSSLPSLNALYWDFGNYEVAKRMKSIPQDLAVIQSLTKLQTLGLVGGGSFTEYFPEATGVLGQLKEQPDMIHKFLDLVKKSLPPQVGVAGLAVYADSLLSFLVRLGHTGTIIDACIVEGMPINSFLVAYGISTNSPVVINFLHSFLRSQYDDGVPEAAVEIANCKAIWKAGADVAFVHFDEISERERDWRHLALEGRSLFTIVAANSIRPLSLANYIFGELLPQAIERYQCTPHALLIVPETKKNVFELAAARRDTALLISLIENGVDKMLDLNLEAPFLTTGLTVAVAIWDTTLWYSHDADRAEDFFSLLLARGVNLFAPCSGFPEGVGSGKLGRVYADFVMKNVASGHLTWPFKTDDDHILDYLDGAISTPCLALWEHVVEKLVDETRVSELLVKKRTLGDTFSMGTLVDLVLSSRRCWPITESALNILKSSGQKLGSHYVAGFMSLYAAARSDDVSFLSLIPELLRQQVERTETINLSLYDVRQLYDSAGLHDPAHQELWDVTLADFAGTWDLSSLVQGKETLQEQFPRFWAVIAAPASAHEGKLGVVDHRPY